MVDYIETIEVCNIKIGICSKLNEYMEIYMYQRSRSYFYLCPRSLSFINFKTVFVLKPLDRLKSNYILRLFEIRGPKFIETIEVTFI